jgi:hypothetical protein
MAKILIGLLAAVVLAAAGFFGFQFYVQHRVAEEVDVAFAQIRASGGKASHGNVSFDLWHRTLVIADIAAESPAQPPASIKIASFTASGVRQPDPTRFSADSIDVTDIDVSGTMQGWRFSYKAPRMVVRGYTGPATPLQQPASSSPAEISRVAVNQFRAITAASITADSLSGTLEGGPATGGAASSTRYSGLTLRDVQNGKIASTTIDRAVATTKMQLADKPETSVSEIAAIALSDFDINAVAAMLDPADKDQDFRIYRQISTGAASFTSENGPPVQIDGIVADDIEVRPSRLQLASLMAMLPAPGTQPTPAQNRALIDRMSSVYEGFRIGNAELHGISIKTSPDTPVRLKTVRFNVDNGKIGEFAFEGLDAASPKGPITVARFALKSLDVANLLRLSSKLNAPAAMATPDQLFGLLPLLEGAEITGAVAPYKDSITPVSVEHLNIHWGQFIGPIPTMARATLKMVTPIDATDPSQQVLVAAGIGTAAINLDLGAAWTESTRSFVLEPATFEFGGVLSASAHVALGNVPRELFSINPLQAAVMATQVETGPIELTLRDIGGVDLAIAQYARARNLGVEDARAAIIATIKATGAGLAPGDADMVGVADAIASFVETPRGTLTIKLTPQGKVSAIQLIQAWKADPITALTLFQIAASTGR